jgi:hypothetical protein
VRRTSVGKVIAAAAPTRVGDRLATASGTVAFLHRGDAALYVEVDGWCVGVVGTAAAAVPCALRVATPGVGHLSGAAKAELVDGVLHLDDEPLVVGRTIDVSVPRLDPSASERHLTPPRGRALGLLAEGDPRAVPLLVGRGSGLTPAGDDVLCGWLAIRHAAGAGVEAMERAVRASLSRTTTLSATLLDCALHGEVLPEFAALVQALGDPAVDSAPFVDALAGIGHTSGRALLLGAELALASLARAERSRCA